MMIAGTHIKAIFMLIYLDTRNRFCGEKVYSFQAMWSAHGYQNSKGKSTAYNTHIKRCSADFKRISTHTESVKGGYHIHNKNYINTIDDSNTYRDKNNCINSKNNR